MGTAMKSKDDDIDVLAMPKDGMAAKSKYVRPTDSMVLPPLASMCECELVVNEDGKAMVIFNKTLPEGIHWVEYDMDLSLLTFVMWSGNIMELGIKIHAPFRKYLKMADNIIMVQMSENGQEIVITYSADLVIRNIGI